MVELWRAALHSLRRRCSSATEARRATVLHVQQRGGARLQYAALRCPGLRSSGIHTAVRKEPDAALGA